MKKIKRVLSICLSLVLIVCMFPIYSSANNVIETAIAWATGIANDNTHGYSQTNRYGPDYDCSSLVTTAFRQAGLDIPYNTYTGNMVKNFQNAGFVWIPASSIPNFPQSSSNLKRGDVVFRSGHTELYIGNNQNIGAHDNYNGIPGGIGGEKKWSSGYKSYRYGADEIDVCKYWNGNWTGVLRYGGGSSSVTPPPTITYLSIPEGEYKLQNAAGKYLGVESGGNQNANVHAVNGDSSSEQKFRIKNTEIGNQYYIKNLANTAQYCVNAYTPSNTLVSQSDVRLWDENTSKSKYWGFEDAGGGYYYIRCMMNPQFVLTADGYGYPENVTVLPFDGRDTQKWKLETIEEAPVQKEYTITYKWEGGRGGPSTQKKPQGEDIEIFDDYFPNRFGYSFVGWSTSENADKAQYIPGSTFTKDADTTLYAVWGAATELSETLGRRTGKDLEFPYADKCRYYKITPKDDGIYRFESTGNLDTQIYIMSPKGAVYANDDNSGTDNNFLLDYSLNAGTTYYIKIISKDAGSIGYSFTKLYTVTYNANGGSGAPETQYKLYKTNLKLSTETPTRQGYTFLGWASDDSAKEATIKPGAVFTGNRELVLYAVWKRNVHEHNWKWITDKEATCMESGKRHQECECGATQNEELYGIIHDFGEWVVIDRASEYPFTITEQRTCSLCGEIETREAVATTPILPDEILYGDAYSDGIIDELDALVVLKYAYGWTNVEIDMDAADAFKDGIIDELDAINILKKAYGWNIVLG